MINCVALQQCLQPLTYTFQCIFFFFLQLFSHPRYFEGSPASHVSSDKTPQMRSYLKAITVIVTILPHINSKEESSSL